MEAEVTPCPACGVRLAAAPPRPRGDAIDYECRRCGNYWLTGSATSELATTEAASPGFRYIVSYSIRQAQHGKRQPRIDWGFLERIKGSGRLPSPAAQAENLLLWLGEHLSGPGERVRINDDTHGAIIGTTGHENFHWIINHLVRTGILEGGQDSGGAMITLSYDGWQAVEDIKRGHGQSRIAFMAMPYGDAVLDDVVRKCFQPAVEATGFRLERLDEDPKAGLIDDRLRVKIRTSRFLVADLTAGNQGAYWEAGFAEGLGKPVIYTCENEVFTQKKTHFDTNHHLTISWDKGALADAAKRLTATIRATLPDEAKLSDG